MLYKIVTPFILCLVLAGCNQPSRVQCRDQAITLASSPPVIRLAKCAPPKVLIQVRNDGGKLAAQKIMEMLAMQLNAIGLNPTTDPEAADIILQLHWKAFANLETKHLHRLLRQGYQTPVTLLGAQTTMMPNAAIVDVQISQRTRAKWRRQRLRMVSYITSEQSAVQDARYKLVDSINETMAKWVARAKPHLKESVHGRANTVKS